MSRSPRAGVAGLALLLWLLGAGCLVWSPPAPDDDDSASDDDDSAAVDDDDSTADDDDTTPAGSPVDQSALGAIAVVRFNEIDRPQGSGLAAIALADGLLSPSAEEAAFEDAMGYPVITSGAPGVSQTAVAPPGRYDGPYVWVEEPLFLSVGADSVAIERRAAGWATSDGLDLSTLNVGDVWTLQLPEGLPFAGFHEGPPLPSLPVLSSSRLVGGGLFVHLGSDFSLEANAPSMTDEPDVFSVMTDSGGTFESRAWSLARGQAVSLAADELADGPRELQFFYQRSARTRVEGVDGALLLSTANWAYGSVVVLNANDLFFRPVDPSPPPLQPGATLVFDVAPPLLGAGDPFELYLGGFGPLPAVSDGSQVQVTLATPSLLPSGWVDVSGAYAGGTIAGRIELRAASPNCEVLESGSNNFLSGANPIVGGQVVCGGIDPVSDQDVFELQVTLGVTYRFEIWAQRLGSTLDPVVAVLDAAGSVVSENDDFIGIDSRLDYTATATGPIYVSVRSYDAASGSATHTYRLATSALESLP